MPIGKCTKCGIYGDVERHHYYPKRWFGRQNKQDDTEPLCCKCHTIANRIQDDIDIQYEINSPQEARYYKGVFKVKFLEFMNSCMSCNKVIKRNDSRIWLLERSYHSGCLLSQMSIWIRGGDLQSRGLLR